MKRLRHDIRAENVAPMLIFIFVFFIGLSTVLWMLSPIFYESQYNQQSGVDPADILGGTELYDYWTPTDGVDFTWDDDAERVNVVWETYQYTYTFTGAEDIDVLCVRNNTLYTTEGYIDWYERYYDFIAFKNWLGSVEVISFAQLENSVEYDSDGTVSGAGIINIGHFNESTLYRINFPDDATEDEVHSYLYDDNSFNLQIAYGADMEGLSAEDVSWTSIALKLITLQHDTSGIWFIDILITAIIDAMLAFLVLTLMLRVVHGE